MSFLLGIKKGNKRRHTRTRKTYFEILCKYFSSSNNSEHIITFFLPEFCYALKLQKIKKQPNF